MEMAMEMGMETGMLGVLRLVALDALPQVGHRHLHRHSQVVGRHGNLLSEIALQDRLIVAEAPDGGSGGVGWGRVGSGGFRWGWVGWGGVG